jgi:GT2 family glycosyltransferase
MRGGLTYSVVLPTAGTRSTLRACVDGIQRQATGPADVTVVGTTACERPPWLPASVAYITAPASSNGQRNAGARAATGDLVLFVDDDIVLDPWFGTALLEAWHTAAPPMAGVSGTLTNDEYPEGWVNLLYFVLGLGYTAPLPAQPGLRWSGHVIVTSRLAEDRCAGFLAGCCVAYRRTAVLAEPFDETFSGYVSGGDLDMAARMRSFGNLYQSPAPTSHAADVVSTMPARHYEKGKMHGDVLAFYRWRHRGPGLLGTLAWEWANVGQILVLMFRGFRLRTWQPLRGYFAGLASVHGRIRRGECQRWRARRTQPR